MIFIIIHNKHLYEQHILKSNLLSFNLKESHEKILNLMNKMIS